MTARQRLIELYMSLVADADDLRNCLEDDIDNQFSCPIKLEFNPQCWAKLRLTPAVDGHCKEAELTIYTPKVRGELPLDRDGMRYLVLWGPSIEIDATRPLALISSCLFSNPVGSKAIKEYCQMVLGRLGEK